MDNEATPNRSIGRLCSIINCFNDNCTTLTLSEISGRIGLPVSTTHRLLDALVQHGLLRRDPDLKRYQPGYRLIRWGSVAQASIDLRNLALPLLHRLSAQTCEDAVLSIRHDAVAIWLEVVHSRQTVTVATRLGMPLSLHAGASSKVLWAFLPEAEALALLDVIDLVPLMHNTITDRQAMRRELELIRRRGYATSFEETDPGAMGICAPVFDHTGRPVAGIGIVAPILRVPPEKVEALAQPVLQAGQALSERIGGWLPEEPPGVAWEEPGCEEEANQVENRIYRRTS